MSEPISFKWFQDAQARSIAAYDDGSTCTLTNSDSHQLAIAVRTAQTGANGSGVQDDLAHTIDTTGPEAVAFKIRGGADTYVKHDGSIGTAGKGLLTSDELAFTVAATQDQTLCQHAASEYVVRRLTPEECERLQGMSDNHTRIPWRGKPAEECPDGPRYKAIGNSFAVPVVRWLGIRLEEVDRILREAEGDARE